MKLVVLGLSLASSWGNGHATTWRALLRAFAARGHDVTFLERSVPWYAGPRRDLPDPGFCRLAFYHELAELDRWREEIAAAVEKKDEEAEEVTESLKLGRKLPPFPKEWQDDAHRVPGCQSQVWMEAALRDGRMYLAGASDAAIVSGLVALLLRVYSGRAPAEVLATDPVFLKDLGLLEALSTNRGSGIASMARKIGEAARACSAHA